MPSHAGYIAGWSHNDFTVNSNPMESGDTHKTFFATGDNAIATIYDSDEDKLYNVLVDNGGKIHQLNDMVYYEDSDLITNFESDSVDPIIEPLSSQRLPPPAHRSMSHPSLPRFPLCNRCRHK